MGLNRKIWPIKEGGKLVIGFLTNQREKRKRNNLNKNLTVIYKWIYFKVLFPSNRAGIIAENSLKTIK